MEVLFEILKYSLPAGMLLLLAYLMFSSFIENEEKRRHYFLKKESQKTALPTRMQAYERLTLFLERIHPDRLLLRVSSHNLKVRDYQNLLSKQIRSEYEHNLSQQIYVSEEAWRMVVNAKSTTIGHINTWAQDLDPEAPAVELRKHILNKSMELESNPIQYAIRVLRTEIQENF